MYRQNQKTVTSKCTDDRGDVTRDDSQRGPKAPYTLTRFSFFSKHCCSKALSTLKSMRFRCHRKRIDRFASTLKFSCVSDCYNALLC